ncbi:CTP synthase ura7 [Mitosporidium daphniae]|uniref:CTP synthase n=1 Tax=Mitosporidium daphniae TaxID=1485682 RepID=A0A098VTN2_9MICR|nr:CTP synthase [Mitosporidium daphniae]KGG52194.1 CTP synthase [Mitosporidium daphniae]|eukprot:XP_013238621.1 CTP synthase [Mitosporidium daphniae]
MTKFILVTGGVISGVGKGIIASSTGFLLRTLGFNVTAIKIDPYLNIDAGTISPLDHGEVFVLDDGGEVDMDLGNYERFLDVTLTKDHNLTTGKIYSQVIERERKGDYLGKTVQVVPHLTNAIQNWVERVSTIIVSKRFTSSPPDICIVELGGTVGDIESAPFIEAMRQFQFRVGHENFCCFHVSLVPVVGSVGEQKTKPTQASVRDLRGLGISPDFIICRSTHPLESAINEKISMFCHVPPEQVLAVQDCPSLYHVPLNLHSQNITKMLCDRLKISPPLLAGNTLFDEWKVIANCIDNPKSHCRIALVGKYTNLSDSYISVIKSMQHASLFLGHALDLVMVEASNLTKEDAASSIAYDLSWKNIKSANGILVPGGFGSRGTEGMLLAAQYARENKVPFFGICLGFQIATIEAARNLGGLTHANSSEIDPSTPDPVIKFMPEISQTHLGGTMRLGARAFKFVDDKSQAFRLYGGLEFTHLDRHRHRYEVNPEYVDFLEQRCNINFVARDAETGIRMEILEIDDHHHPYYVACQFHPEFMSRPLGPSPLIVGFIRAASINIIAS